MKSRDAVYRLFSFQKIMIYWTSYHMEGFSETIAALQQKLLRLQDYL